MAKITRKTNIGELVEQFPEAGRVLAEEYGLHCVGCMAARFDTLGQGAKMHGMGEKEIEKMVKRLNIVVKNSG